MDGKNVAKRKRSKPVEEAAEEVVKKSKKLEAYEREWLACAEWEEQWAEWEGDENYDDEQWKRWWEEDGPSTAENADEEVKPRKPKKGPKKHGKDGAASEAQEQASSPKIGLAEIPHSAKFKAKDAEPAERRLTDQKAEIMHRIGTFVENVNMNLDGDDFRGHLKEVGKQDFAGDGKLRMSIYWHRGATGLQVFNVKGKRWNDLKNISFPSALGNITQRQVVSVATARELATRCIQPVLSNPNPLCTVLC